MQQFDIFNQPLKEIKTNKTLINTINAYCFNLAKKDPLYLEALINSDVLLPDGVSITWAMKWLTGQKLRKIAGMDLFYYEMERLQRNGGKCFFLGSTETILNKIKERASIDYPNIKVDFYSPPFKSEFTAEDTTAMLESINAFQPDVLMIGMTAPKQEKWAYQHFNQLQAGHICCVGAVFDFYAGTIKRAPKWMIYCGLEWLHRLLKEPKRLWKRYLIGNNQFIWHIIKEKFYTYNLSTLKEIMRSIFY
ncbi:MAG: WecB/TagA/CpsF family glycosyltransferase [Mariniphaga sp.]|nr:WecB/TagA/CpsF family glycosyltransferase [Mariniphaga sp.]